MSKKKTAKKATKTPKRKAKPAGKKPKLADPAHAAAAPAPPPKPTKINVSAAKGRPMLTWVGKRPLAHVTAFPAQLAERHDALRIVGIDPQSIDAHDEKMQLFQDLRSQCNNDCWKDAPFINGVWAPEIGGLLLHGDNRDVLGFLLLNGYRGRVSCIYIDPPFDSAADYVRRVNLRGAKGSAKVSGADYTLGEQIQYSDIWVNDAYLQFMFERLLLMRELLAENGSFFLHADAHRVHHLRALLDEVFGADAFRNQISWKRTSAHGGANRFGAVTDFILFYGKGPADSVWNPQFQEITQEHKERHYRHSDERGVFALGELTAPGITNGPSGQPWRGFDPRTFGRHWAKHPGELDRLDSEGFIYWPATPGAWPRLKRYWTEHKGRPATDFWDDIDPINMVGLEREDYPTQKPEALVERMLLASTNPGDLVLDCFIGSGTTAAVAQKLGRRWIGCDINKGAIQTTVKRLRGIIAEQIASARKAGAEARQGKLMETGAEGEQPPPKPCAFGFTVWRVNDYDLQIQHNEAVNLACEHIGIERTRSDSYFEGTLGKKLVKIIPFGHPLTPLDLEELKRELDARPDEDRNIVVVCLGMELAAKAWIDDWNRLRKGKDAVNKIDAIELRTDPKYGRFIKHEPASARVKVSRTKRGDEARIVVEIQDFISPTIVERLSEQAGVLSPKIEDWRAMVDCVYIDTAYNGSVLNVALADVPERKADFVEGKYDLPAPDDETTVAVKIVDMLGEVVLVMDTA